jgi:hypothetical protein
MSYLDGDSTLLATCQMLMTMVCGYAQMRYTCGYYKAGRTVMPPGFYRLAFVEFPTIEYSVPDPHVLGLPDPDPLVRGIDPDPSISNQKL